MADEKEARGMLLRHFLDAETRDHPFGEYDVVERAEAFFKKSEKEEQERISDYCEWVQDIVRQPHPEIDFEDDPIESTTQMPAESVQNDVTGELAADLDQALLEADADIETGKERGEDGECRTTAIAQE
jgi:hypothetical protein